MSSSIQISLSTSRSFYENKSLINQLPKGLIVEFFYFLDRREVERCGLVCRRWKDISKDHRLWNRVLQKMFPSLRIFDELHWGIYADLSSLKLCMEDVSPFDYRTSIPVLRRLLSSSPIEGEGGVTLLTLPKGLTLNKLVDLAKSPKQGNATNFRHISNQISKKLGDIPFDKTYRVVITNNILMGSRSLSVNDQKNLVKKIGCEIPKVLEVATLLVVTYMHSKQRLYTDIPLTYTRCAKQVSRRDLFVVGGFDPDGLFAHEDWIFNLAGSSFHRDDLGISAVWRF